MRKLFLSVMLVIFALGLQAQVVMNLQLPPLGVTIKPQLWNLSLVNNSGEAMDVRLEMEMTDVSNNQLVFKGISRLLNLPRGAKQVHAGDVIPVTYTAGNPGYPVDPNPDGFLPIGVFNVCYTVTKLNSDAPEQLSEDCITLEVEPLSPPQLVLPVDSEYVDFTRPFFAWMPPSPVNSYQTMFYDWILVEVQATQSAADAIQQNIPVYTRQHVSFTSMQYPLSMPELDSSKLYAWRITAKNNSSPVANSEIWTFRVRKQEQVIENPVKSGYYARLSREENASFIICNGILRFAFEQDQNSTLAEIQITDISSKQRKRLPLEQAEQQTKYGQNLVQLDLRESGGMINGHMYLLELTTEKKEKWFLRFEYRQNYNEGNINN